jgi:hypothetical protein
MLPLILNPLQAYLSAAPDVVHFAFVYKSRLLLGMSV